MSEVTVRIKEPHPKQKLVIDCRARRVICRSGRRFGKSVAAAIIASTRFLEGHRVLYAVPVSDQLAKFWFEVCAYLRPAIEAGLYKKNETDHTIEPAFGASEARIRGKTAWNADTLRGDYADVLILDEFQMMKPDAWALVGAPLLLDNNGQAYFFYTGREGAIHASRMYKKARLLMEDAIAKGEEPRWVVFNFSSFDNPLLPKEALAEIGGDMSARAYSMEIMANDDEDHPHALWSRALLEKTRRLKSPDLQRIVVGVDPPGSVDNDCGIIVAGVAHEMGPDGDVLHGYVLEDMSLRGTPETWAGQVVSGYHKWEADKIVAEQNFGGDMVEHTIHAVDNHVPVKMVRASRGKAARAEPIVAFYERDRVHHVGEHIELESEMTRWHPTLAKNVPSPNRLDAAVWALSELMLDYCATELGTVEILMV